MRPFDDQARAQMKLWVENWKRVGPILEAQRTADLRRLDERGAARIAVESLRVDQPITHGDAGEGLVAMAQALRQLSKRS